MPVLCPDRGSRRLWPVHLSKKKLLSKLKSSLFAVLFLFHSTLCTTQNNCTTYPYQEGFSQEKRLCGTRVCGTIIPDPIDNWLCLTGMMHTNMSFCRAWRMRSPSHAAHTSPKRRASTMRMRLRNNSGSVRTRESTQPQLKLPKKMLEPNNQMRFIVVVHIPAHSRS